MLTIFIKEVFKINIIHFKLYYLVKVDKLILKLKVGIHTYIKIFAHVNQLCLFELMRLCYKLKKTKNVVLFFHLASFYNFIFILIK